jgi:hypothetical protein
MDKRDGFINGINLRVNSGQAFSSAEGEIGETFVRRFEKFYGAEQRSRRKRITAEHFNMHSHETNISRISIIRRKYAHRKESRIARSRARSSIISHADGGL